MKLSDMLRALLAQGEETLEELDAFSDTSEASVHLSNALEDIEDALRALTPPD